MKKIFFNSSFFKITFLFVLFFGGMGFDAKAQNDSTKIIFENALRDIYCITAGKVYKEYSSKPDKNYNLNSNLDCDKELTKFKSKITTDSTLSPVMYSILTKEKGELGDKINENKEVINTVIKSSIFPILESKYSNKFNSEEKEKLKNEFTQIIEKANDLVQKKIEKNKADSLITADSDSISNTPQETDFLHKIIPPRHHKYILSCILALTVFNFLMIFILFFVKTGKSSNKTQVSKEDFDNLEKQFTKLNLLVHKPQVKSNISKNEDKKTIIQEKEEEKTKPRKGEKPFEDYKTIQAPIITNRNSSIKTEIKFAKRPSSSGNVFSQESLFDEDNNDAIYKITVTGNTASFVVNSTNSTAMNKAMSNLSDFIDNACESSNSANQGTTIRTEQYGEGKLELKDNIWHIIQKAKIQFV